MACPLWPSSLENTIVQLEKVTKEAKAQAQRSYGDACAAAHALDILGERWALLVVREMMTGPKRFTDIRANIPGLSANVLTQRLHALEAAGVVVRRALPAPASGKVYALTPWGYEAEPIFQALGRWGSRSPWHDRTAAFSAASLVLSLRTMFAPARTGGRRARVGLVLGRERFVADVDDALTVERSDGPVEVELTGDPRAVAALLYAGVGLAALERDHALRVSGDRLLLPWFAGLFPLPEKLPGAGEGEGS